MTAFPIDLQMSRGSNLPDVRDPHFTGRDAALAELRQRLETTSGPQVVSGLAGVGKSALAREYAQRSQREYSVIWWIRAADPVTLSSDLQSLGSVLSTHPALATDSAAVRSAIRRELEARDGWLLIFDDASDPAALEDCIPRGGVNGHVIVTTRNGNWPSTGAAADRQWHNFPLAGLDRADSVRLLRARSGRTDSALTAAKLAQALGDLPMALEQAAALIAEAHIGFEEYLYRFEAHWGERLRRGPMGGRSDPNHAGYGELVAMTLELSIREIERSAAAGADLLKLAAFLAPAPFRVDWFGWGVCRATQAINPMLSDVDAIRSAMASLGVLSLVEGERGVFGQDGHLRVHAVVGELVRQRMTADEYELWSTRAVNFIDTAFRFDAHDLNTWRDTEAMLPHALSVAGLMPAGVETAYAVRLYNRAGEFLLRQARFIEARPILERAMELALKVYDTNNPRLASIANNLARALQRLGELQSARDHLEWALALDERTYGPDHPHVAELLNNYAMCLAVQDDHAGARAQFERALAIYEACGCTVDTHAAIVMNNLGYVRMNQGDIAGGWELLGRALDILQVAHGPSHPDVAGVISNRGHGLRLRGNPAGALAEYQRALKIDESVFGPNHPNVARDLSNMGQALQEQKQFGPACERFARALAIDEKVLGATHPIVAQRLSDLGRCLKAMDDVDGAVACFSRAAALRRSDADPARQPVSGAVT